MAVALYGDGEQTLRLLERSLGVEIHARGNELRIRGTDGRPALARRVLEELYRLLQSGQGVRHADVRHVIRMLTDEPEVQLKDIYENILRGSLKTIRAKNLAQRRYVDLIQKHDIAIAVGPAGTGKTYLAMAMAVAALNRREISRIILTRPAVEAGERLGFLPGDLAEKVDPYMRPLYDALRDMMDVEKAARLIERGTIEVAPLAFMRGRTLNDSFVILDEAQNTTGEQMKMFLTRLGENSKAVITGDVTQIDLPSGTESGLVEATRVLRQVRGIGIMEFAATDVVRHPLVQSIIQAYAQHGDASRRGSPARHVERSFEREPEREPESVRRDRLGASRRGRRRRGRPRRRWMNVLISGPPDAIRWSKVDVARLRRRAGTILRSTGEAKSELSIALVDDASIEVLNGQYRGKRRPTDVLSFSLVEGEHADRRGRLLGDVVISVETAARQARERRRGLDETIARLLVHGVLHLLGHDHEEDDEARRMQAEERRIWRVLRA
ncbi:MAG: rRNA maturation RNase YbeY [Deltaproteobacteria bacterium]|nr:rRNA maturation RNase YbeY [Deltaproteobacteria bacterium]